MSVVIVVPTYNERENLPELVARILGELPGARVLVVDDNSPDGTGEVAEELAAGHPEAVHVLHRPRKEGLGAACIAGFRHALAAWPETEFVVQMDGDLSHDPAYLKPLLAEAAEADVVIGSRYVRGIGIVNWPLHRLILSRLGTAYARAVTGLPITDCTSGYRCFRAEVLRTIDLDDISSNGYVFMVETNYRAWRLGYRLRDVPIIFRDRTQGESKLTLGIAVEAIYIIARLGLERLLKGGRPAPRR